MKKNLVIVVLIAVSAVSLAYGYLQRLEADRQHSLAMENMQRAIQAEQEAKRQRIIAQEQKEIAEMNMMEAMKQREIALQHMKQAGKK